MSANEQKFSIDVVGETSGKTWKGVFKTKIRLSHRDQLRQDELRRDLLGKNPESATPRAKNQADVFSTILAHLIETPQWWEMNGNGLDLEDDNVVGAIYDRVLEVKLEAAKALKTEAEAARAELTKAVEK